MAHANAAPSGGGDDGSLSPQDLVEEDVPKDGTRGSRDQGAICMRNPQKRKKRATDVRAAFQDDDDDDDNNDDDNNDDDNDDDDDDE
jgi:hypothetical protein